MSNNFVLDKLKQIAANNKVQSFARTANSEVALTPLTIKQQKDIIKTALDVVLSPITFAIATSEIVKENIQGKLNLTILDKPLFLLALRANSLGTKFTAEDNKTTFDFAENLNQKNAIDTSKLAETLSFPGLDITTRVPAIEEDYKINLECKKVLENKKSKEEEKVKDLIGEIYIYEIIKFIDSIKLTVDGKVEEVKFNVLSIQQKVETVENLPMAVTSTLIESIAKIRAVESEPLKVLVDGKDVTISLDTSFFTKE
jgi:hypothetical protein